MYTPVDLEAARNQAMMYLDAYRPAKVYTFGPTDPKALVDQAIRRHGYHPNGHGVAAGQGFTRYVPDDPAPRR